MAADTGPLPSAVYPTGTMAVADIYPSHVGIGGIGTQGKTIPAFAEATVAAANAGVAGGALESHLFGQPAGWLVAAILALVILAWTME